MYEKYYWDMSVENRQSKGRKGEALAEAFLKEKGITVLEANVRCALGELDLVCRDGTTLVFVEVRTRYSANYGLAVESVSPSKQRKLMLLARWYLQRKKMEGSPARFDVIGIDYSQGQPRISWIPNAFEARE